jgi:hypothetical protein
MVHDDRYFGGFVLLEEHFPFTRRNGHNRA